MLFAPLNAVAMRVRQRGDPVVSSRLEISSEPEWTFRYGGSDERGVRYEVYVGSEAEGDPRCSLADDEERYTALPKGVSDRVRQLAHRSCARAQRRSKKRAAIEALPANRVHLRPRVAVRQIARPARRFLFVSQRGHCEFYSTAMVVLLRELQCAGPQRTGFIGGSYNRFGHYYAVRQGDAHSWVEVFVPERGWQTFDPTPPAEAAPRSELSGVLAFMRDIIEATGQRWDRYVVGYDLRQQVYLFHRFLDTARSTCRLPSRVPNPPPSSSCARRGRRRLRLLAQAQGATPKCHDRARSCHARDG